MTWIETRPEGADAEALAKVAETIVGKGKPLPEVLASQGLHPRGLEGHFALYRAVMKEKGALPAREKEAVATVVSALLGCEY